jgi:tRNA(Ile)-lysidine synthase
VNRGVGAVHADDPLARLAAALAGWPDGPLRLAFSGGHDSTALLHALASLPAARERDLRAIHVDHGLHPDSGRWAGRAAQACTALGVPFQHVSVVVDRHTGSGLEAAAREARHGALAAALPAGGILVAAHHADDQAETVLLRLLRAAGPDGLCGMRALRPFAGGWLARPWLDVPRARLRAYLEHHGLAWIEDPANADPRHDRSWLRAEILPRLAARFPHAAPALARSAALLTVSRDALSRDIARELARRLTADPTVLDATDLAACDAVVRGQLLRRWLPDLGLPPPDARALAELGRRLAAPRDDAATCVRWPGAELRLWRGRLYAMAPLAPPVDYALSWDTRQLLHLPDGTRLRIDGARGALALAVRPRAGGERLTLDDGTPPATVKSRLPALGIPPWRRARAPLLWHGDDLWAVGDWLLATPFRRWLDAHDARFRVDPPGALG